MTAKSRAVLIKDFRSEYRSRYAINAILLFGLTTLMALSFAVGQAGLGADVYAALYWIIIFFSAMSGLAQVFVKEEESGTATILRLTAEPMPVFLGKLTFNLLLLLLLDLIIAPLFFILTDAPLFNPGLLILVTALGSLGLAGATTLVAAIVARSGMKGALFAVLSFPLLLPLLVTAVGAARKAMTPLESPLVSAGPEIRILTSYAVVVITAGLLLFDFVWEE